MTGQEGMSTVTRNESDPIVLRCNVSSKPASNITLSHDGNARKVVTNTNQITFEIRESTCDDTGIYTCSGNNIYNTGGVAKADIKYFVRCKYLHVNIWYCALK